MRIPSVTSKRPFPGRPARLTFQALKWLKLFSLIFFTTMMALGSPVVGTADYLMDAVDE